MFRVIIFFFFILCLIAGRLNAQKVSIVNVEQASQKILVTYQINKASSQPYNIELYAKSKDRGVWYGPLEFVSGDISEQQGSDEKRIFWDVRQEWGDLNGKWIFGVKLKKLTRKQKNFKQCERNINNVITLSLELPISQSLASLTNPVNLKYSKLNCSKRSGFGFYFATRFDPWSFNTSSIYTSDNSGEIKLTDDSAYGLGYFGTTNEIDRGNLSVSAGVTKKVFYPMWISFGAGFGRALLLENRARYSRDNIELENVWVVNTDETGYRIIIESDLQFKIHRNVLFRYGAYISQDSKFTRSWEPVSEIGLGFVF